MTSGKPSLGADYFDGLYGDDPDPWRFRTSDYERQKYAATLDVLPRPHYASAFEAGCSIGVFTRLLKARCDRLLAVDLSEVALAQAWQHCAGLPGLEIRRAALPTGFPSGHYDLIVLSEILYFMSAEDVEATARLCADALGPDGDIVLCHWTGETNYPLGGDEAVESFLAVMKDRLQVRLQRREPAYRLDVLGR